MDELNLLCKKVIYHSQVFSVVNFMNLVMNVDMFCILKFRPRLGTFIRCRRYKGRI